MGVGVLGQHWARHISGASLLPIGEERIGALPPILDIIYSRSQVMKNQPRTEDSGT